MGRPSGLSRGITLAIRMQDRSSFFSRLVEPHSPIDPALYAVMMPAGCAGRPAHVIGSVGGVDQKATVFVRSPTQGAMGTIVLLVGVLWTLGSFGAEVSTMTSVLWAIPGMIFGLVLGTRAFRMGIRAGQNGLTIRNLGRTYDLRWSDVQAIRVGRSNNVTGAVSTLFIDQGDGETVVVRGASSYSAKQVGVWLDDVLSAAPAGWRDRGLGASGPQ